MSFVLLNIKFRIKLVLNQKKITKKIARAITEIKKRNYDKNILDTDQV